MDPERALLHELRNMLAVMLGYAEIAGQSTTLDPDLRADMAEMKQAGERAMSIVQELQRLRGP